MSEITYEDVNTIAIFIQLKNGNAHQVLASKENKHLALTLLAKLESGLKLTTEIEPVQFKLKKK